MKTKKLSMDDLCRISVEEFKKAPKLPLVVVLDNVRSQNNIGSVFRTADAFRVEQICLCGICSTPPHRDIHKTALGAEESVDWLYYESTTDCVKDLLQKGYGVFAVEQAADSVMLQHIGGLFKTQPRVAVVFGNEVEGVQNEVIELCDGCIEIPQFGTKHSLNVSCAAAIVMWEISRLLDPDNQLR